MELSVFIWKASVMLISAGAAVTDLVSWKVPNLWLIIWCAAGLMYEAVFFNFSNMADRLLGAAAPVLLLGFFFFFHMMGAGDIKLLSTLGIWMGSEDILICVFTAFIIGAAVSVIKIAFKKNGAKRLLVFGAFTALMGRRKRQTTYNVKTAGTEKIRVAVLVFAAVLIKLAGVY